MVLLRLILRLRRQLFSIILVRLLPVLEQVPRVFRMLHFPPALLILVLLLQELLVALSVLLWLLRMAGLILLALIVSCSLRLFRRVSFLWLIRLRVLP